MEKIEEMARECGLYMIKTRSHLGFYQYKFSSQPIKCWGENGIEFKTPGEAREFLKNLKKTKLTSHAKKIIAAWQRGDEINEEELYQLLLKIDELDDDLALELGYVSKCYYRG